MKIQFAASVILLASGVAHADFPTPTVVSCNFLSEVAGVRQADASIQLEVGDVESCESKVGKFEIPNTPIKLGFAFVAACQRPTNSYPEHLSGVRLMGPIGSSIYANAFTMDGFKPQQSLQLTTSYEGKEYNIIAHCKIVR